MRPKKNMWHYRVFGLNVESEIELEGVPLTRPSMALDLRIERGAVDRLDSYPEGHPGFIETEDNKVTVCPGGVARFLIEGGRRITVEPVDGIDASAVLVYLLGIVPAVALIQRGWLTYHAGVVGVGGAAVAFAGDKGGGKSTMVSACLGRGHRLLCEDLLAMAPEDGEFRARPGFPRLKLHAEGVERSGLTTDGAPDPVTGKFWVNAAQCLAEEPMPLRRVYLLEVADEVRLERLEPQAASRELFTHWFGLQFGTPLLLNAGAQRVLAQSAALASQVPVCRLSRPKDWDALPAVLDAIEEDLAERESLSIGASR